MEMPRVRRVPTVQVAERLFEVEGGRVVWHKSRFRPRFSLASKPAAFAVMERERLDLLDWGAHDPRRLERRMEDMVLAAPAVAYEVARQLVDLGAVEPA